MAQVTFVQRSVSAQTGAGVNNATVTGHASAAIGDLQVLISSTGTAVTPGGTGWTQLSYTTNSNNYQHIFTRVLTAGNIAQAQATMTATWNDIGRFEVRTYRNATHVDVAAQSLSLTSAAVTIPAESMVLRVTTASVSSATARNLTPAAALVNQSGVVSFSWYAGLVTGDEPGAALTLAPSRVATNSNTANTPVYISTDLRVYAPQDVSGLAITNLTQHINAPGRILATWSALSGVTHYEYTVDDGPIQTVLATSQLVTGASLVSAAGLEFNTTKSLKVRGANSGTATVTPWAEISATVGSRYEENYNTDPIGSRVTIGSTGGTWTWDGPNTSITQTNSTLNSYALFESIMPRSTPGYFDMTASVTLMTDPSARKHLGLFPQGVDGNALSGYRIVNLDGAWEVSRYTNNAQTNISYVSHGVFGWDVGETKVLRVKLEGTYFTLFVNGVKALTWTDSTYTSLRPGYWTYGNTSRYDTLTYVDEPVLPATVQVPTLTVLPLTTGAQVYWGTPTVPGVNAYQYRLNGGAPVTVSTTSTRITGLTTGVQYLLEVRPANSNSQGAWRSATFTAATPFVFDDFERPDVVPSATALGTPVNGPTWTQAGSLGITNGASYASAGGENIAVVPAAFNVDITYIVQTTGVDAGIVFRYRDTANNWLLQFEAGQPVRLYRRLLGTHYQYTTYPMTLVAGMRIRVLTVNTAIFIYVNDRLAYTLEDIYSVPATDTFAGIRQGAATSRIDSIHVMAANTAEIESIGSLTNVVDSGNIGTVDQQTSHVYKGRDTKTLDTIGAA